MHVYYLMKYLMVFHFGKKMDLDPVDTVYDVVYYYALFLFDCKQSKSRKYFEYCLKLRPLNSLLHYQFSLLLSKFWKDDVQTAWYYLKLSHRRNYIIANALNPKYKLANVDKGLRKYAIKKAKKLYLKCGKNPKCANIKCNVLIARKEGLHTCSGCKCIMYCSRRCQKIDWKLKHRKQCIAVATQKFSLKQMQIIKQIEEILDQHKFKRKIEDRQLIRMFDLTFRYYHG